MTATRTAKPAVIRTARLLNIGGVRILALTVGTETTAYCLEATATGYRLTKADAGAGPRECYDVRLDGASSSCGCKGFRQHGMCKDQRGCKHIAGLTALVAQGRLSVPQRPAVPVALDDF